MSVDIGGLDLVARTLFDPPGPDRRYLLLRGRLKVSAFLPADAPTAAARSLLRRTDETRMIPLVGRAVLATGLRSRLLPLAIRERATLPGVGDASLARAIADLLGLEDLIVAGALGPVRPNLKPVLQIFGPDGGTVAFVKVGWNDLTRELVEHEHATLASITARDPLRLPRALGLLRHGESCALVLSPLPLWRLGRRPRSWPDARTVRTIAESAGPIRHELLSTSTYWNELSDLADDHALPHRESFVRGLDIVAAGLAEAPIRFGASHGDFSPWNTLRSRGTIAVWDWERFRADAPVGLDLVHYVTQMRARRPIDAMPEVAAGDFADVVPGLTALGVDARGIDAFVTMYYLDLLARYVRDSRRADVPAVSEMSAAIDRALMARLARADARMRR